MQVNDELVSHLAHLSRLSFSPNEKESIRKDLEKLIGFVNKLNELDTSGVNPLRQMSEVMNVMREDEHKGSVTRDEALLNAANHNDEFFKVPKVINRD